MDLRTLDTGISLRNNHLRDHYLEVDKEPGYDKAILSDIVLQGVNADAPQGNGSFAGSLTLHGVKKTINGSGRSPQDRLTAVRVKASFPLWAFPTTTLPSPRYLGVGVKNTVQVEVVFTVSQESAACENDSQPAGGDSFSHHSAWAEPMFLAKHTPDARPVTTRQPVAGC